MDARRTRLLAACAGLAFIASGTLGCSPADDAAAPTPTVDGSTSTPTPTPTPTSAAELVIPDVVEGEIARAVMTADGPGGVPETALTTTDAVVADESFRVEGACVGGGPVDFDILTAAVGDSGEAIASGTITCDGDVHDGGAWATPFSGPVQFAVRAADDVDLGWLVVVPNGG